MTAELPEAAARWWRPAARMQAWARPRGAGGGTARGRPTGAPGGGQGSVKDGGPHRFLPVLLTAACPSAGQRFPDSGSTVQTPRCGRLTVKVLFLLHAEFDVAVTLHNFRYSDPVDPSLRE